MADSLQRSVHLARSGQESELELAGVEFAPPLTEAQQRDVDRQLQRAAASGDWSQVPPPRTPLVPVFADRAGRHFVLLTLENGESGAVRFRIGRRLRLPEDDPAMGGFVSLAEMRRLQARARPGTRGGMPAIAAAAVAAPAPDGRPGGSAFAVHPLVAGLAQQAAAAVLGRVVQGAVGAGAADGLLAGAGVGASIAGAGIDAALSAGSNALLQAVFGVEDSDSMAKQLAHHAAKTLLARLQSSLSQKAQAALFGGGGGAGAAGPGPSSLQETVFGVQAPDGPAVSRFGDVTDHAGIVNQGEGSVLVEGSPAATIGHWQVCPAIDPGPVPHLGGPVEHGNPTVLVAGQPVARTGHAAQCLGCGCTSVVQALQATVMVGAASTEPPPMCEADSGGSPAATDTAGPAEGEAGEGSAAPGSSEDSPGDAAADPDSASAGDSPRDSAAAGNETAAAAEDGPDSTAELDEGRAEGKGYDSAAAEAAKQHGANEQKRAGELGRASDDLAVQERIAASDKERLQGSATEARADADRTRAEARNTAGLGAETPSEVGEVIRQQEAAATADQRAGDLEQRADASAKHHAAAEKVRADAHAEWTDARVRAGVADAAGKVLGVATDVYTASTAIVDAHRQFGQGDAAGADRSLLGAAGDIFGGGIGAYVAVAAVGAVVTASAPVLLVAAGVGGFIGATAGEGLGEGAAGITGGAVSTSIADTVGAARTSIADTWSWVVDRLW